MYGEAPAVGRAAVAQTKQWHGGAVGQLSADVSETAVMADGQVTQLWPAVFGPGSQPLAQGSLGRLRRCGHGIHDGRTRPRRVAGGVDRFGTTNSVCLYQVSTTLFSVTASGTCCWPGPVRVVASIAMCYAPGLCWPL